MIAIVDSGSANLGSVYKALENVGAKAVITADGDIIKNSPGVIFPGVGAFDHAARILAARGLDQVLKEVIEEGKPFLGICLGFQLLLSCSEEFSPSVEEKEESLPRGLDIIKGMVRRFPAGLPVPHVGWNRAIFRKQHPLTVDLPELSYFYFTHSFYVEPLDRETILSETEYNGLFVSSVARDNLMGVQFHPEKSGAVGLKLLRNFAAIVDKS